MQVSRVNDQVATVRYDNQMAVEGSGPPLIFVPGMDGTGRLFYRQVPLLASHFRVGTYALRDDAKQMGELVEDLDHTIQTIAPDGQPAVVVGESFGGTLALSYTLAHPERVRWLVVINSFARFLPQFRLRLARAGVRSMPWGVMGIVRRVTAFRLHSRHTHRSEIRYFLRQTKGTTRHGYLGRLGMLAEYDVRARLGEIRVPTLFIASDEDHLIPSVEQATYMAARVPGATMRVLEGHGHACLIAPGVDLGAILREWQADAMPARTEMPSFRAIGADVTEPRHDAMAARSDGTQPA
jgi:pimeloyl-ACP methyl ester carboxylesterase